MKSSAGGDLPAAIRRLGKVHHVALIVRSIDDASRGGRLTIPRRLGTRAGRN